MAAVIADSVSLSPNLISDTARVSFSFTMGMTPMSNNSLNVLCAFWYLERCDGPHCQLLRCPFMAETVTQRREVPGNTHIGYVVPRQQDLGDGLLQVLEEAVPDAHQAALADGGEGLQLGEVLGALLLVHAAQADADGARGDDDDAVAILAQLVGGLGYEREVGEVRLVRLLVDDGACS